MCIYIYIYLCVCVCVCVIFVKGFISFRTLVDVFYSKRLAVLAELRYLECYIITQPPNVGAHRSACHRAFRRSPALERPALTEIH